MKYPNKVEIASFDPLRFEWLFVKGDLATRVGEAGRRGATAMLPRVVVVNYCAQAQAPGAAAPV